MKFNTFSMGKRDFLKKLNGNKRKQRKMLKTLYS